MVSFKSSIRIQVSKISNRPQWNIIFLKSRKFHLEMKYTSNSPKLKCALPSINPALKASLENGDQNHKKQGHWWLSGIRRPSVRHAFARQRTAQGARKQEFARWRPGARFLEGVGRESRPGAGVPHCPKSPWRKSPLSAGSLKVMVANGSCWFSVTQT